MSGIAGIYNFDGRPADASLLRRMTDAIAHRGPDGVGHWVHGPVALGHRMLHTTPESLLETQPLTDETGNLCLTLDGRVDNREELRAALEAKRARLRDSTDAELVLRAYECWGEECPAKIIGDFVFAIWDGRKRQLFCARDPFGMKPFFYYQDERRLIFGSEMRLLFEDASVPREPNEGMIGEYLARSITHQEETLFRDAFRLPPAHCLVVHAGGVRKARYWDFDLARQIRYRSDEEYADHFRELFRETVRCRLRSHRPVGAHLSGGVDSSSVVGMVSALASDEALPCPGFETFSMIYPGLPCDESSYIRDVVQITGFPSNLVPWQKEISLSLFEEEVRRHWDFPTQPNGMNADPLAALARDRGFRVLLSGIGGDEWLAGSFFHYADLLRRFHFLRLLRQAKFDARNPSVYVPAQAVLRMGLYPLLPRLARRLARRVLRRKARFPPYLNPQFATRIHLQDRMRGQEGPAKFCSYAQRGTYVGGKTGFLSYRYEMVERRDSLFCTERRDPLHDRRIAEFALALPEEQRWRDDYTKIMLRQAMRGRIPESVRWRRDKPDFSVLFSDTFLALGGENLFDSLEIARLGWVDADYVRKLYREMTQAYQGRDTQEMERANRLNYVNQLWMVWGTEFWYRAVFMNHREASSAAAPAMASHSLQPA